MSCGPSTLGTMMTSSLWPISGTRVVRSSSTQGESRLLIRVHSWVSPKSFALAISTRPSRAASFFSVFTASSRLPRRMSTFAAIWGTLAAIFSLLGSKKWIIRLGRNGTSARGAGAPTASGRRKARGLRTGTHFRVIAGSVTVWRARVGAGQGVTRAEVPSLLGHVAPRRRLRSVVDVLGGRRIHRRWGGVGLRLTDGGLVVLLFVAVLRVVG